MPVAAFQGVRVRGMDETSAFMLLKALANLSENHPSNRTSLVDAGGLGVLLALMRHNASSPSVQSEALIALANLSSNDHTSNQTRIVQAGAIKPILAAMRYHKTNASVQEYACSALWTLACDHAANKSHIVDEGGVALVLSLIHI